MAYWQPTRYKNKKIIRQFGDGINTFTSPFDIKESQLVVGYNVTCDDYPAIRTRNDRTLFANLVDYGEDIYLLGKRENTQMHALVGTASIDMWVNKDVYSTDVFNVIEFIGYSSTSKCKFIEFNTEAIRYTILASDNGTKMYYDGSTVVTLTASAPKTHLYTVYAYRVFGVENNYRTIKYSAIGSCVDWTTLPGFNSGSFDLTNAKGPITGITTFADHVVIFTENSMHELWNKEPINFNLQDISLEIGCYNNYSYVECNNKLYFLHKNGIYEYSGGVPRLISQPIQKYIDVMALQNVRSNFSYCAGAYKNKVYFRVDLTVQGQQEYVLVYDTLKNVWTIEDSSQALQNFENIDNKLYSAYGDNIYNFVSTGLTGYDNSTQIKSHFVTKAYNDFNLDSQLGLKDIWLMYSGTTDASMSVYYTTNIEDRVNAALNTTVYPHFQSLIPSSDITFSKTVIGYRDNLDTKKEQFNVPTTSLQNASQYQLKFDMSGHVKINGLQMNCISVGGE